MAKVQHSFEKTVGKLLLIIGKFMWGGGFCLSLQYGMKKVGKKRPLCCNKQVKTLVCTHRRALETKTLKTSNSQRKREKVEELRKIFANCFVVFIETHIFAHLHAEVVLRWRGVGFVVAKPCCGEPYMEKAFITRFVLDILKA